MRRLTTAREVVNVLGGVPAVCELTQSNPKAVYHWTGRAEMFPARTYKKMNDALRRKKAKAPPWLWNQLGYEKYDKNAA
jgi:hypothetical protein